MTQNSSILMKYAINYLSKYSSSKANLERILRGKIRKLNIEKKDKYILYNSIENIIDQLEKNNYINDHQYISSKINLFFNQGKSKIFLKSYFMQKGIDRDIIDKALKNLEDENDNWELDSAKIFAKRKRLLNYIDNKEKIMAKLARAGFNYNISKKTIDAL